MSLSTAQIVEAVRAAGLRDFTARKLERWANLGLIPHPVRVGKGRGKGWKFSWPDEALTIALLVADALVWQKGRRLADAALWAWLRGAPVSLPLVRRYLRNSFRSERKMLEDRLRKRGGYQVAEVSEDEVLDALDRLAQDHAYKQKALRASGLPVKDRLAVSQEVLTSLLGRRWSERRSRKANRAYEKAWETIAGPLGLPYDTDPREMRRQQTFFALANLEELTKTLSESDLQAARDLFAKDFYLVALVLQEHTAGHPVPKATLARARKVKRTYDALFQLSPAWVWGQYLYGHLRGA